MKEFLYIGMMTAGVLLFALGGTGFKWARRFVFPGVMAVLLYFHGGVFPLMILSSCLLLAFILCMGYGESKTWLYRGLVFASYALPSLLIGWSYWAGILVVGTIGMFALSNFKPTEISFPWKLVEGGYGFLISASFIGALHNTWVII